MCVLTPTKMCAFYTYVQLRCSISESNPNDASLHLHHSPIPEDSTLTALGPTGSDEQHMVIPARSYVTVRPESIQNHAPQHSTSVISSSPSAYKSVWRRHAASAKQNMGVNNSNLTEVERLGWNIPVILNTNHTSVENMFDEICVVMQQNEVDVGCVIELWFKSDMPDELFNIEGYGIPLRNDHVGRKGGGRFAYVRSNMVPNRLSELEDPNLELLWFTIRLCCLPREFSILVFGVIYHPQYPNPDYPMIEHIHKSLDSILQKHPDAVGTPKAGFCFLQILPVTCKVYYKMS